ncbi:sugar-binding protein [Thermaerobacillus caldiproteolyticus]|uniref:sugar-binding protein n=1 Tax=Thermaerobacillus caldiproteolyticus TaxID=247480 RepID=UPI0018F1DE58|nr:sugar-binding protein [Anoxybacillus caldiproteolyticus]
MRRWWKWAVYIGGMSVFAGSASFTVYCAWKVYMYHQPEEKPAIADRKKAYHFVLVPEELDNDYWRLVEKGAKAAAKEMGVRLEYIGPRQANIEEHVKILEKAAASKVDGIMTQGLTEQQFTPIINRIVEKNIPVITIDTDAPTSRRTAYIGTDNYYAGFIAGRALVEDTGGNANVAIITGSFEASHQQLRVKGFQDAVKHEKGTHIIAIEESDITRVQAAEKAYKILKEHPEVNAFYGTSALDAIGIAKVIEQFHRERETYVIGFDTLPETIHYLEKGTIEATVVQEPYEMGYRAVKMMVDIIEGNHVPSINNTETRVIRKQDLPLRPARNYEVKHD